MASMQHDAHTEPSPQGDNPGYLPRQLILLGAGHAHLQLLAHWKRRPMVGPRITLIAPHGRHLMPSHIAGFVAGTRSLDECSVEIEPLVRQSGVRWLTRSVRGLDVTQRTVLLDDLSTLQFDWLSINTGAVQNRAVLDLTIPGIREHGLFLRPMESFCTLWPKVADLGESKALRIALIGAGGAGTEIAMAIKQRLPSSALTLVDPAVPVATWEAAQRARLAGRLRSAGVTCIQDQVVAVGATEITLASGARLACDVPVVATGPQAPYWLKDCGLGIDAEGFVQVDHNLRSLSHPFVFAAGDVRARFDTQSNRDLTQAALDGQTLARNLASIVAGQSARATVSSRAGWRWLETLNGRALLGRGRLVLEGRVAAWLKRWRDARLIRRYRAR